MCEFKSAIVTATGDLLHNPFTDSHEDLVRLFKLNDTATVRGEPRFCRVEFKPENRDGLADVDKYVLRVDEERKPEWFDEKMEKSTVAKLRLIIAGMIISGEVDILIGGAYILAKGAKVGTVKNALIHVMMPQSKVGEMWGSSNVGEMRDSSNVQQDNRAKPTP